MDHVYGQTIRFAFTALDGEENPTAPAALVSARLYLNRPTNDQMLDHVGALAGFEAVTTTWAAGTAEEKILTFAPLTDPYPLSNSEVADLRYIAVSFKYESGAPTQVKLFPIRVRRGQATTSRVSVDYSTVKELDEKIAAVKSQKDIEAKIKIASRMALRRMMAIDSERAEIEEADLNDAVLFLACQLLAQGLVSQSGDVWANKADTYGNWFEQIWSQQRVRVDVNDDGLKDRDLGEAVRTWSGEVTR